MGLPKAWMSWSTGKDSAWALDKIRTEGRVEVTALLTTVKSSHLALTEHD